MVKDQTGHTSKKSQTICDNHPSTLNSYFFACTFKPPLSTSLESQELTNSILNGQVDLSQCQFDFSETETDNPTLENILQKIGILKKDEIVKIIENLITNDFSVKNFVFEKKLDSEIIILNFSIISIRNKSKITSIVFNIFVQNSKISPSLDEVVDFAKKFMIAPDMPMAIMDNSCHIVHANPDFSNIVGSLNDETSMLDIVHGSYLEEVSKARSSAFNNPGELFPVEFAIKSETDEYIHFGGQLCAREIDKEKFLIAFFNKREVKMDMQTKGGIFYKISEAAHTADDLDDLFKSIHELIHDSILAKNFYVALYDKVHDGFRFPYFIDEFDKIDTEKIYDLRPSLTRYVYETGKPLLVDEETSDKLSNNENAAADGPDSPIWLGVPLIIGNEKIGVIAVQDYSNEEAYSNQDLQFLTIISNQIARAIENKKQDLVLQESEQIHRTLFENVPVGILLIDHNKKVIQANEHFQSLFRTGALAAKESVPQKLLDEMFNSNIEQALTGKIVRKEGFFNHDDGTAQYIQTTLTPIKISEIISGVLILAIDLTSLKRAEENEKQKAAHLEQLIDATPEAIAIIDNHNTVTRINHAFRLLFGVEDEEIIGKKNTLFIPEDYEEENENIISAIQQGEKCIVETVRLNKSGRIINIALSVNPIIIESTITGSYWLYRDITRQKWTENLQAAHLEIMHLGIMSNNLTEFLESVHKVIDNFMHVPNFYVCLFYDDKGNAFFPYHSDVHDSCEINEKVNLKGTLTDYVRVTGRPLQVNSEIAQGLIQSGKVTKRMGESAFIWLGIPLMTQIGNIGVAAIQKYDDNDFYTTLEQDAIELFSNHIAVAIQRISVTAELRESEERFRKLITHNPVATFHINKKLEITFVNDSLLSTFDANKEDYIGLSLEELKDTKSIPYMKKALKGEFAIYEGEYISRKNKKLWIEAHYSPLTDSTGEVTGVLCVFIDLTDRKEAEAELAHQKAFLEQLLQNAPEAIIIVNPQNKIQQINLQFSKLFGFLPNEAIGREINELIVPRFMMEEAQKIDRIGLACGMINTESVRQKKDGSLVDVKILASPVMIDGKAIAHYGIYHDISAQKKIEQIRQVIFNISQATNQSENLDTLLAIIKDQLFTIIDTTNFSIATYNQYDDTFTFLIKDDIEEDYLPNIPYQISGGITDLCFRAEKPMWLTRDDIVNHFSSGNAEEIGKLAELWMSVPLRIRDKVFGLAIIQSYNKNHKFTKGDLDLLEYVSEYIASAINLRQTHDALTAEKEKLSVTLSSLGEGVITTDVENKILLMNRTAEKILGWTINDAFNENFGDICPIIVVEDNDDFVDPVRNAIKEGSVIYWPKKTKIRSKNNIYRFVAGNSAPIFDKNGNIIGVVNVIGDVTDQIMMEDELLRARKLESVALLAGGIAHDFNNILQGITGNLSIATYMAENSDEELKNTLIEAEKATIRARELTLQLLTFSKGGNPIRESASIVELIKETTEFTLTGSNVRAEFNFHPDLWYVNVDKGQFNRVIQNLVINADQAMPTGGILRISAVNVTLMDDSSLPLPQGKYVQISVTDEGVGIAEESLNKIFDPYFTTKDKGNGLGLATTFSIIKKHDGYITVRSTIGKGTSFVILLPAISRGTSLIEFEEDSSTIYIPSLKILVMDDEEIVLKVATGMLKLMGHQTTTCYDGNSAIDHYKRAKESGEPYDIIITDLTIPGGLGGVDTVDYLRKYDPDLCAIASSGYSNNPVLSDYESYGYAGIASKPYTINDLEKAIQKVARKIKKISKGKN